MENKRYRRTRQRLTLIVIAANTVGVALIIVYFDVVQSQGVQSDTSNLTLTFGITAALLLLGNILVSRRSAPMYAWYRRATANNEIEPASPHVRQLALNMPLIGTVTTLGMWLLAGLIFGVFDGLGELPGHFNWANFFRTSIGMLSIASPITAVIVYFATERVWRSELALFFPAGNLSQARAFRVTVRGRLLIIFAAGATPLLLLVILSYSYAVQIARAPQPAMLLSDLLRLELFITTIGVLVVVSLVRTLGASLVESLETLGQHMAAAQEGKLDERALVTSNDEFGALAEGFNAMLDGLRREEVIRRLFSCYVTPQVADYAIEHGAELGGRLIEASVLFTDIRGFTSMTEQLEPAALIALLNRYFQTISAAIVEHGGLVNKFGGDSLLAIFGTPLNPAADHPHQAVRAAWGITRALEAFNREQAGRGEPQLRTGVGVATGTVLAGNVGSAERLEYTVIGDTVNLASRLEALTKELDATVLLAEATATAVQSWAPLQSIGQVRVRGKQEPVLVYALQTSE